jgi:fructooligosaccharide transport system substrate-binding protein
VLRVWSHQGQAAENAALRAIAAAFNRAHAGRGVGVELSFFPDFHYTEKLSIAAAAHDLPDAFELDGPLVARFVDAGLVAPLAPHFSDAELGDFLPTVIDQGTIEGTLYTLGAFDSAVVLYYDRVRFAEAGIAAPAPAQGFTWPDFVSACERLAAIGVEPLALHLGESHDEWFTYAFSPVVWSGGGELVGADGRSVRGVLSSAQNVRSLQAWQALVSRGFARADPVDPDPFGGGACAMDWSGHWMARSHSSRKGEALGVMVLPRLGQKSVAPCGSFCWAISSTTKQPELAALWVRWITDPSHGVEPLIAANGAIPGRKSVFSRFPEYETLPYVLFRQQLEQNARPRPRTPFYATLTRHFAAALRDMAHGSDVASTLGRAERDIARVIERRLGRPPEGAG